MGKINLTILEKLPSEKQVDELLFPAVVGGLIVGGLFIAASSGNPPPPPPPPPPPGTGNMEVKVTNSSTGAALPSNIAVNAVGYSNSQFSADFTFPNVPIGEVNVMVSATGFTSQNNPVNFTTSGQIVNVALVPVAGQQYSNVTIVLQDASTGASLNGTVNFGGIQHATTGGSTVFTNVPVSSTEYTASATVSGYTAGTALISVPSTAPVSFTFHLTKTVGVGNTLAVSGGTNSQVVRGGAVTVKATVHNQSTSTVSFLLQLTVTNHLGQVVYTHSSSTAHTLAAGASAVDTFGVPPQTPGSYTFKLWCTSTAGGVISNVDTWTGAIA